MNHTDRVRAFLRSRKGMGGIDPEVIYTIGVAGTTHSLTTSDLDALCRDSEYLRTLEV